MTRGKVRYSDFAVIDAILVCLNLSEDYHTGMYYYSTCFICADISRQSELLLPQIICQVTEGFFVFCLVLILLWSNKACRKPYCFNWTCPTCVRSLQVLLFEVIVDCSISKELNCSSNKPYVEVRSYIRRVHATIEAGSRKLEIFSYKENQITVRTSLQWLCANKRKVKGHAHLVVSLACSVPVVHWSFLVLHVTVVQGIYMLHWLMHTEPDSWYSAGFVQFSTLVCIWMPLMQNTLYYTVTHLSV